MVKSIQIRSRKREEINLNLTPLIDVVFLLLIFFMVSTTFKQNAQLAVELPQSKSLHANQTLNGFELGITAAGVYVLDGITLGTDAKLLEQALKSYINKHGLNSNTLGHLMILGDKMAPHQAVVSAMDVAQKLGIVKIRIITEHTEGE